MTEIHGEVSPSGAIVSGSDFDVDDLGTNSSGHRRFKIQLTFDSPSGELIVLTEVPTLKSTERRDPDGSTTTESVEPKASSLVPQPPSFVVTTGYTKAPRPNPGHHGFTFVAVGESQGSR